MADRSAAATEPSPVAAAGASTPKREGSPWTGLWAVTLKELADHLTSIRMRMLEGHIQVV